MYGEMAEMMQATGMTRLMSTGSPSVLLLGVNKYNISDILGYQTRDASNESSSLPYRKHTDACELAGLVPAHSTTLHARQELGVCQNK